MRYLGYPALICIDLCFWPCFGDLVRHEISPCIEQFLRLQEVVQVYLCFNASKYIRYTSQDNNLSLGGVFTQSLRVHCPPLAVPSLQTLLLELAPRCRSRWTLGSLGFLHKHPERKQDELA